MTLPPQQLKTKNPTERAKEHLRQIKEGETIEADANQCGFYIMRSKPSQENLEHLLGKPNAAYIMAGNDLYYFNKVEKIHLTRIKLDEKKSLMLKDELRDFGLDDWSLTDGETSKRLINKLSIKQLKKITEITGHDQKEKKLWSALKTIPLLTGLITKAESTGHSFTSLEQLTHFSKSLKTAGSGLQITSVVLSGIDFIRIPMIYVAAFVLGKDVPFTLSKRVKWVFSAAIFALGVAALAVPAVGVPLAITAAALSLGGGIVALGRHFYKQYQIKKEIRSIDAELEKKEQRLDEIKIKADGLHHKLDGAVDNEKKQGIYKEIEELKQECSTIREDIQGLKNQKLLLEKKLERKSTIKMVDKMVGVFLGAVVIVGLSLSIFFPPVGLGIVAGAAAAGLIYSIGRITFPFAYRFGKWLSGKIKNAFQSSSDKDVEKKETPSLTVQPGENASPINKIKSDDSPSPVNTAPVSVIKDSKTPLSAHSNSITDIAERLYGNEARRILKEQYGKDLSIDTLDDTLNTYLSVKDEQNRQQGIIKFFAEQAKHIYHHSPKASSEDIFDFFERLNNFDKSAVKLLNQALSNYNAHPRDFNLGKESIKAISTFPAFREALSKKGIDDSLLNQSETMVTDNSNASPELTEDSSEGESEGSHLSQHL